MGLRDEPSAGTQGCGAEDEPTAVGQGDELCVWGSGAQPEHDSAKNKKEFPQLARSYGTSPCRGTGEQQCPWGAHLCPIDRQIPEGAQDSLKQTKIMSSWAQSSELQFP